MYNVNIFPQYPADGGNDAGLELSWFSGPPSLGYKTKHRCGENRQDKLADTTRGNRRNPKRWNSRKQSTSNVQQFPFDRSSAVRR